MPTRKASRKKRAKAPPKAKAKPGISRYEYAQLCVQLATVQAQMVRNRTDLDIQLRRIAQLQDEVDMLRKALATTAFPTDSVLIPLPKPTTES